MFSIIADIVSIVSCVVSVLTFISTHTILKNTKYQRTEYENERRNIQSSLMALRDNIWEDTLKFRSKIRTELFSYRQKYLVISSLHCIYHLSRAIRLCTSEISDTKCREKLCVSLDYLIARFDKSEVQNHE